MPHYLPKFAAVLVIVGLSFVAGAQQKAPPPKPTPEQMQKAEDAHRGIFAPKANPADDASRRTN